MPFAGKVTGAISGASMIEIAGGMVPFPDQMPEVFAETILAFLARKYPLSVERSARIYAVPKRSFARPFACNRL